MVAKIVVSVLTAHSGQTAHDDHREARWGRLIGLFAHDDLHGAPQTSV